MEAGRKGLPAKQTRAAVSGKQPEIAALRELVKKQGLPRT
jgi:hypothetical protein